MLKNKIKWDAFLTYLFLLSVFLLSLNKIGETDFWMHISIGRLIWGLKGLPDHELFPYTMTEAPFLYTSWLFGPVYYLTYQALDVYGVILLKAITVTIAFYILLKDSLRPNRNYIVSIIVMSVVVMIARHRFVERPDTFLMVFLSFSIFSLNAFVYDNKRYLYALPFVHMIWANSHSSINLMAIPFLSFIIGGLLQRYLAEKGFRFSNTPSVPQLKAIILVFVLSVVASLLNPNFIGQYTYGPDILSSAWKHKIMEFFPPTWKTEKWPYLITVTLAIIFTFEWFKAYRLKGPLAKRERPSLIPIILVIPFIVLAFSAVRFISILGIVAGPVLAKSLSALLNSERWNRFFLKKGALVAVAAWMPIYAILVLPRIDTSIDFKSFGFGIVDSSIPEGALSYMDRNGIMGRVFNEFGWGGYIVWRDFPRREVFIDPRTQLSSEIMDNFFLAADKPAVLDYLEKRYGFESVLIAYPSFVPPAISEKEEDAALLNPKWALVYWDDQALVYLKRGGKYASIIKKDEYMFVKPANSAAIYKRHLEDESFRIKLIEELWRNVSETRSKKAHSFLDYIGAEHFSRGVQAYEKQDYLLAIEEFKKSIEAAPSDPTTYCNLGYTYYDMGILDKAFEYQHKAIDIDPNLAYAHYGLALTYMRWGDNNKAIQHFKDYLRIEPSGQFSGQAKDAIKSLQPT